MSVGLAICRKVKSTVLFTRLTCDIFDDYNTFLATYSYFPRSCDFARADQKVNKLKPLHTLLLPTQL